LPKVLASTSTPADTYCFRDFSSADPSKQGDARFLNEHVFWIYYIYQWREVRNDSNFAPSFYSFVRSVPFADLSSHKIPASATYCATAVPAAAPAQPMLRPGNDTAVALALAVAKGKERLILGKMKRGVEDCVEDREHRCPFQRRHGVAEAAEDAVGDEPESLRRRPESPHPQVRHRRTEHGIVHADALRRESRKE
jgi:hypothetical protein